MCHRILMVNLLLFLLIPLAIALTGGCRYLQGASLPTTVYARYQPAGRQDDRTTDTQAVQSRRAPSVSKAGNICLQQADEAIPAGGGLLDSEFGVTMQIKGGIGYFAGQTNGLGQTLPIGPHRFLALERLWLDLDFTREPQSILIDFNGKTYTLAGISGVTHYQTYLIIPDWPSTLTWDNVRLSPPLILRVQAAARDNPGDRTDCSIEDIELTGDVYDITYAQPGQT